MDFLEKLNEESEKLCKEIEAKRYAGLSPEQVTAAHDAIDDLVSRMHNRNSEV